MLTRKLEMQMKTLFSLKSSAKMEVYHGREKFNLYRLSDGLPADCKNGTWGSRKRYGKYL